MDLQERNDTPEPASVVAGDEAEAREALGLYTELDALIDGQLAYDKERGKMKKADARKARWDEWVAQMSPDVVNATPVRVAAEYKPGNHHARAWLHLDYRGHVVTMYGTPDDYWRVEVDGEYADLVHYAKSYGSDGRSEFLRILADIRAGKFDKPKTPAPTPAEKLTAALAEFIESVTSRYANE